MCITDNTELNESFSNLMLITQTQQISILLRYFFSMCATKKKPVSSHNQSFTAMEQNIPEHRSEDRLKSWCM